MKNALWEIMITQNDCPMIDTTKIYPGVFILMINTEITEDECQYLFSILGSSDSKELGDAIRFLSSHPRIKEFNLISKTGSTAIANYRMIQTAMYKKADKIGFRLHPILVANGKERWFFVTDEGREITERYVNDRYTKVLELRRLTQEEFSLEYPSIFFKFYVSNLLKALTPDDALFLKEAIEHGYFDWPRNISLTELSTKMNMPKSTVSYRVRKVLRKVMHLISQDLSPFK